MYRILLLVLSFVASGVAQPLIYNRAILNAASFMPSRLPGGAIAQGSIFSVFGKGLGPSQPAQAFSYPLATSLGNVTVTITQGAKVVNAIPIYVSDSQMNAIMPSNAPVGTVSLRVTFNNARSNPMTVIVSPNAVGLFTAKGTGIGPGIFQNFVSQTVQPINSPTVPAKPGQAITLWGTGLGPVASDTVAPKAGSLATKVEVLVGGVSAAILYSGRAPCCAGTDQIVFTVPSNAPEGCWVPVSVRTGGAIISNMVTMAITSNGTSCFLPHPPPFVTSGTFGVFVGVRASVHEDVGTKAAIDVTADYQAAIAVEVETSPFPFHPILSIPPEGTCTAYSVKGDLLRGDTLPGFVPSGKLASLGSVFNITGPRGVRMTPGLLTGKLLNFLGAALSGNQIPDTLFLEPGAYTLTGAGGGLGAFSASLNLPAPLTWTNRDQLTVVDRTQPLPVSWTGGASDQTVAVVGFGVDLPTNTTTVFGCLAPSGANSVTVPPQVLANVPSSRPNPLSSKSIIYLVSYPDSALASLNATGLDAGYAAFAYVNGKTVIFQ